MIAQISTSLGPRDGGGWLQVALFAADKRIDEQFRNVVWIWHPSGGWRWLGEVPWRSSR